MVTGERRSTGVDEGWKNSEDFTVGVAIIGGKPAVEGGREMEGFGGPERCFWA